MKYRKTIYLNDGRECVLRSAVAEDGAEVLRLFNLTHDQTDYLISYPEESSLTVEQEANYLQDKSESENEIELLAEINGRAVGLAGIDCIGKKAKVRHRAGFGISIDREYWHLGIGRALTKACIECAKTAGYIQLELEVVNENDRAIALYKNAGFVEYGHNPKGFNSRLTGWQELVLMRLELQDLNDIL